MTLLPAKVKIEHFVFAPFNGVGYQLVCSRGVQNLLLPETLRKLLQAKESQQSFLPYEKLVAVTFIRHVKDCLNRDALWNHTLLIPISVYFHLNPPDKFREYMLEPCGTPIKNLKPVEMKIP